MPLAVKRKISEISDGPDGTPKEITTAPITADAPGSKRHAASVDGTNEEPTNTHTATKDQEDRRERFKELQARAVSRLPP